MCWLNTQTSCGFGEMSNFKVSARTSPTKQLDRLNGLTTNTQTNCCYKSDSTLKAERRQYEKAGD